MKTQITKYFSLAIILTLLLSGCQKDEQGDVIDIQDGTLTHDSILVNLLLEMAKVDGEIQCIDFEYPVTLFQYNAETENLDSVVISNDVELFLFLTSMDEEDYMSLEYPILTSLSNGAYVEVLSDQELVDVITDCLAAEIDPITLSEYLRKESLYVNFYFVNSQDETEIFCEFEFTFNEDNTVNATNGIINVEGTWEVGNDVDGLFLELNFGNTNLLEVLNGHWQVLDSSPVQIGLERPGDSGSIDILLIDHVPTSC